MTTRRLSSNKSLASPKEPSATDATSNAASTVPTPGVSPVARLGEGTTSLSQPPARRVSTPQLQSPRAADAVRAAPAQHTGGDTGPSSSAQARRWEVMLSAYHVDGASCSGLSVKEWVCRKLEMSGRLVEEANNTSEEIRKVGLPDVALARIYCERTLNWFKLTQFDLQTPDVSGQDEDHVDIQSAAQSRRSADNKAYSALLGENFSRLKQCIAEMSLAKSLDKDGEIKELDPIALHVATLAVLCKIDLLNNYFDELSKQLNDPSSYGAAKEFVETNFNSFKEQLKHLIISLSNARVFQALMHEGLPKQVKPLLVDLANAILDFCVACSDIQLEEIDSGTFDLEHAHIAEGTLKSSNDVETIIKRLTREMLQNCGDGVWSIDALQEILDRMEGSDDEKPHAQLTNPDAQDADVKPAAQDFPTDADSDKATKKKGKKKYQRHNHHSKQEIKKTSREALSSAVISPPFLPPNTQPSTRKLVAAIGPSGMHVILKLHDNGTTANAVSEENIRFKKIDGKFQLIDNNTAALEVEPQVELEGPDVQQATHRTTKNIAACKKYLAALSVSKAHWAQTWASCAALSGKADPDQVWYSYQHVNSSVRECLPGMRNLADRLEKNLNFLQHDDENYGQLQQLLTQLNGEYAEAHNKVRAFESSNTRNILLKSYAQPKANYVAPTSALLPLPDPVLHR